MEIAYYCDPITHLYWPPVLGGRSTALSTVTIISSLVLSYQVFTCSKVIINIIIIIITIDIPINAIITNIIITNIINTISRGPSPVPRRNTLLLLRRRLITPAVG